MLFQRTIVIGYNKSRDLFWSITIVLWNNILLFYSKIIIKSKGELSPRSYPIRFERKWKYSFLSAQRIRYWGLSCGNELCMNTAHYDVFGIMETKSPTFAVRETDVSRYNGGTIVFWEHDIVLRALSSLRGLRGAPEVPPLYRETSVSWTANVGTWLRKRNGGQKWVNGTKWLPTKASAPSVTADKFRHFFSN